MKTTRFIPRSLIVLWVALSFLSIAWAWQSWADSRPGPASGAFQGSEYVTGSEIARLQDRLESSPNDPDLLARLGLAQLQYQRETGDISLYAAAEGAFRAALAQEPGQAEALIGMGHLALARHDFDGALDWGAQARAVSPLRSEPLGILVDAYVELGAYDEAVKLAQAMVELRPDLPSISRVAYLRELHGDMPAAIAAMEDAVRAGSPGHENTLWAQTELGHMHFESGNFRYAAAAFRRALEFQPEYAGAQMGLGLLKAAAGDYPAALEIFEGLAVGSTDPEIPRLLGELYLLLGEPDQAKEQFAGVRRLQQRYASTGADIRMEQALFEADYGSDKEGALALAQAVYASQPSIYAADVLSWALYHQGDLETAWHYNQEARRLDTRDAGFFYHGGVIALARGNPGIALTFLRQALAINPGFSIRYAPHARQLLAQLEMAER